MTRLRVLIPLDGSKLAEAPLSYVSSLRGLDELELTLVSVVDEGEEVHSLGTKETLEREHNVLSSYLRDTAEGIRKHLGLPAAIRLESGQPAEQILNLAKELSTDLLVISTHGRSGAARFRLGSVADKVIRGAPCNVMVMGPRAAEAAEWFAEISEPFKQILVPLDGSRLAEQALPLAIRFAERYQSTLHLVRVVTVPLYGDISGEVTYPDLLDIMEDNAAKYLESIGSRPGMPASVQKKVAIGGPAGELLNYVDDHHIDLVVMTSHGRGGISRAALGSVTDRLIGSPAPVLVVRAS